MEQSPFGKPPNQSLRINHVGTSQKILTIGHHKLPGMTLSNVKTDQGNCVLLKYSQYPIGSQDVYQKCTNQSRQVYLHPHGNKPITIKPDNHQALVLKPRPKGQKPFKRVLAKSKQFVAKLNKNTIVTYGTGFGKSVFIPTIIQKLRSQRQQGSIVIVYLPMIFQVVNAARNIKWALRDKQFAQYSKGINYGFKYGGDSYKDMNLQQTDPKKLNVVYATIDSWQSTMRLDGSKFIMIDQIHQFYQKTGLANVVAAQFKDCVVWGMSATIDPYLLPNFKFTDMLVGQPIQKQAYIFSTEMSVLTKFVRNHVMNGVKIAIISNPRDYNAFVNLYNKPQRDKLRIVQITANKRVTPEQIQYGRLFICTDVAMSSVTLGVDIVISNGLPRVPYVKYDDEKEPVHQYEDRFLDLATMMQICGRTGRGGYQAMGLFFQCQNILDMPYINRVKATQQYKKAASLLDISVNTDVNLLPNFSKYILRTMMYHLACNYKLDSRVDMQCQRIIPVLYKKLLDGKMFKTLNIQPQQLWKAVSTKNRKQEFTQQQVLQWLASSPTLIPKNGLLWTKPIQRQFCVTFSVPQKVYGRQLQRVAALKLPVQYWLARSKKCVTQYLKLNLPFCVTNLPYNYQAYQYGVNQKLQGWMFNLLQPPKQKGMFYKNGFVPAIGRVNQTIVGQQVIQNIQYADCIRTTILAQLNRYIKKMRKGIPAITDLYQPGAIYRYINKYGCLNLDFSQHNEDTVVGLRNYYQRFSSLVDFVEQGKTIPILGQVMDHMDWGCDDYHVCTMKIGEQLDNCQNFIGWLLEQTKDGPICFQNMRFTPTWMYQYTFQMQQLQAIFVQLRDQQNYLVKRQQYILRDKHQQLGQITQQQCQQQIFETMEWKRLMQQHQQQLQEKQKLLKQDKRLLMAVQVNNIFSNKNVPNMDGSMQIDEVLFNWTVAVQKRKRIHKSNIFDWMKTVTDQAYRKQNVVVVGVPKWYNLQLTNQNLKSIRNFKQPGGMKILPLICKTDCQAQFKPIIGSVTNFIMDSMNTYLKVDMKIKGPKPLRQLQQIYSPYSFLWQGHSSGVPLLQIECIKGVYKYRSLMNWKVKIGQLNYEDRFIRRHIIKE